MKPGFGRDTKVNGFATITWKHPEYGVSLERADRLVHWKEGITIEKLEDALRRISGVLLLIDGSSPPNLTPEELRGMGALHFDQNSDPRPRDHWTEEQKAQYQDGYDTARAQQIAAEEPCL
jgi:hypothetical protein